MSALAPFGPATRAWFQAAFPAPTPVQIEGWAALSQGGHALLLAPTGSGKTLAAFLSALDRLHHQPRPADAPPGVRVLYVSPLKALVYDIERNLRSPLAGIRAAALGLGLDLPEITVAMRTGDTIARDRRLLNRCPADILVTTPESLYLLLSSASREVLRTVETVIVDEIHAVAASKRGAHLALSLERLSALCPTDPQRIGLSATQRPLDEIARFLGGDRPVRCVDRSAPPAMDLQVVVAVADMTAAGPQAALGPPPPPPSGQAPLSSLPSDRSGIWSSIHPQVLALVRSHRSTIVFTNSRRLCERTAQRLNELSQEAGGPPIARAHHGSVSHRQREEMEEALKRGDLPCIVATSSLELGIDMGAVDLVIQIESPGSVASALQRVGRAGHGVGQTSVGRIFPKFRGDLLEAAAVVGGMRAGRIEATRVQRNPLDVLCQQLVATCLDRDWPAADLHALVRRATPYRDLSRELFDAVLDMLSGRLPLNKPPSCADPLAPVVDERGFDELRPLLNWDRSTDRLSARKSARLTVLANAGTIPDRGLYGVFVAPDGPRVGELDEEMVHEARAGEVFLLGASSWRIVEIKRDRVLVQPAPGQPGKMPFWRAQGPGRPVDLGREMGALVRQVGDLLLGDPSGAGALALLTDGPGLDSLAAGNLIAYVADQRDQTGVLPTDRAITVERFEDELGDWRLCILSPFGARVNAPWALAIQSSLEARHGESVQVLWTDDGIILRVADPSMLPDLDDLLPDPAELEERVTRRLSDSPIFAAAFREAAGRALLLPKRRPGARVPLWLQRMKAQNLMASAMLHPRYPVVLEAYRECLQEVFDLPACGALLDDIRARRLRLDMVETKSPSPFSRNLVLAFVASWLYEGDAPLAERRVQALSIDRALLRELLGSDDLRELLDPEVIQALEAELQRLAPERRVRSEDGLADLLRRLGDLDEAEIVARCDGPAQLWLQSLARSRQGIALRIGGMQRWVSLDDVARYRDGLGVALPGGIPVALLGPAPQALDALVLRYARSHGPFRAEALAARWGLGVGQIAALLASLDAAGRLISGAFVGGTGQTGPEYCDPDVMRRIKRRTLARLRGEVEPVEAVVLARFLPVWHGLRAAGERASAPGPAPLLDALSRLEACPLPFSELERRILPARVPGFTGLHLDSLIAQGELVWVGRGSLGPADGRVLLLRRSQAGLLIDPPAHAPEDELQNSILDAITQGGPAFWFEVQAAVGARLGPRPPEDVEAALWALVWAGQLTNDTLQPLRALGAARRGAPARPAPARWTWGAAAAGGAGGGPHGWTLVPGGRAVAGPRTRDRHRPRTQPERRLAGALWRGGQRGGGGRRSAGGLLGAAAGLLRAGTGRTGAPGLLCRRGGRRPVCGPGRGGPPARPAGSRRRGACVGGHRSSPALWGLGAVASRRD